MPEIILDLKSLEAGSSPSAKAKFLDDFIIPETGIIKPLRTCKCNTYLDKSREVVLLDFPNQIPSNFYGLPDIYVRLGGQVFIVNGVCPNEPINSPDNEDPPPKGPGVAAWSKDERGNEYGADSFINFRNEWLNATNLFNNNAANNSKSPVVAILDTGIDLRYFTDVNNEVNFPLHYYNNQCGGSNSSKFFGYDFVVGNQVEPHNPFDDDKRHKHGTRIAKIIANQTGNQVRIMSLKTASYKGKNELFDIFCAFEYILNYNKNCKKTDKVKFINASWGYYGRELVMFTNYIRRLTSDGITIITAAGNEGDIMRDDNVEIGNNWRSNEFKRYPAMYSKAFPEKVITVTTVKQNLRHIVPVENYSTEYVNVGIMEEIKGRTDKKSLFPDIDGCFIDPLGDMPFIKGSSYATAFHTGQKATNSAAILSVLNLSIPQAISGVKDRLLNTDGTQVA